MAITITADWHSPFPAGTEVGSEGGAGANENLRPEVSGETGITEGRDGKLSLHRELTPLAATQPEVICLAAAPIISLLFAYLDARV